MRLYVVLAFCLVVEAVLFTAGGFELTTRDWKTGGFFLILAGSIRLMTLFLTYTNAADPHN